MRDIEVLEAGEMREAAVIQPRHVTHQLSTGDGQGHCARGWDHREVGLVILGVDSSANTSSLCGLFEFGGYLCF